MKMNLINFYRNFQFQDLFNEIYSRAQPIEHMNDVAVKFIEENKVILFCPKKKISKCMLLHVKKRFCYTKKKPISLDA
jgi:hypothetical protein